MDIVNMNMNMNMNMDDVIEEIDRICGYGEEGHVNKDTVPKEIELLDKKEYTEQEGQWYDDVDCKFQWQSIFNESKGK